MNFASIQAAAGNLGRWALRRAQERSTWTGLAILATALGHTVLAAQLTHIGDAAVLILGGAGVALAAATTSPHLAPMPEVPSQVPSDGTSLPLSPAAGNQAGSSIPNA